MKALHQYLCHKIKQLIIIVLQEDEQVIQLVKELGPKRWTLISRSLRGRTGKQCRERFV
jgi:hypothetical protein